MNDSNNVFMNSQELFEVGSIQIEDEAQSLGVLLEAESENIDNIDAVESANWRDFDDLLTDSLWIFGARSREGVHTGSYHGNFVPQIPYQFIRRFTRPGDVVLDGFLGSGTSLIEARRQGRHGIGIELNPVMVQAAQEVIAKENNLHNTWQIVVQGDSASEQAADTVKQALRENNKSGAQLLILHPPYHDIIKFTDDPQDLSNAPHVSDFIEAFRKVIYRTYDLLNQNGYLVVVIGDKYADGEWIPLGFKTMEAVQSVGYTLISIIVKNMEGNRAKRNLQRLWRQRAFKGNFYIFKHEYIFLFQKNGKVVDRLKRVMELIQEKDDAEELSLIQNSSFVSGKVFGDLIGGFSWLAPSRMLILQHGNNPLAVVIDLTDIKLTQDVKNELMHFLDEKPDGIIDVSVLANPGDKSMLRDEAGVSQIYSSDETSLEQLAHTLYAIRKTIGAGQREGRLAGVQFATEINEVLKRFFTPNEDYEWRRKQGIGYKFFRRESSDTFDAIEKGVPNFLVGLETKWVSGHENEKAPQISNRFYHQGYELVAIVGHNSDRWKSTIHARGNFADYYLLVNKNDRKNLADVIATRPLLKAIGDKELETTSFSLLQFLQFKKS